MAAGVPTGKTIGFAAVIWMVGFVWGSVVFMTPALKGLAPIPYISRYPAISFPLLIAFVPLTWVLARSCLRGTAGADAGLRVGVIFAAVNILLDVVVLIGLFQGGLDYFAWASVWVGYAILLGVPWYIGCCGKAPSSA